MTTTFTSSASFVVEYCCAKGCGIAFGLHQEHYDRLRTNPGTTFYCPNGHSQHYTGTSDAQKLKDAKARELALRDQLAASIREGESTRKALLRDRQRFMNGVCVCCNRSFENVRRHMTSQHPEFDIANVSSEAPEFRCSCGRSFGTLRGLATHQGHARPADWDNPGQTPWRSHLTRV
jgi:hypothetical protein